MRYLRRLFQNRFDRLREEADEEQEALGRRVRSDKEEKRERTAPPSGSYISIPNPPPEPSDFCRITERTVQDVDPYGIPEPSIIGVAASGARKGELVDVALPGEIVRYSGNATVMVAEPLQPTGYNTYANE